MRSRLRILRQACWLLTLTLAACGGSEPAPPETSTPAGSAASATPLTGVHTFVIVPEESKASYLAKEEFFALAMTKFGLPSGWADAVGTTQAVEGRFQLDADKPGEWLGENEFSVRVNTFTTEREMRDNWIRQNGPRLDDYPLAVFKATGIEAGPGSYRPGEQFTFNLKGTLTIREVPRPATFAIKARLNGNTLSGVGSTRVLLSDFGIETITFYNTLTVSDEIGLQLDFIARADDDAEK